MRDMKHYYCTLNASDKFYMHHDILKNTAISCLKNRSYFGLIFLLTALLKYFSSQHPDPETPSLMTGGSSLGTTSRCSTSWEKAVLGRCGVVKP
jgi:hypothetical protein